MFLSDEFNFLVALIFFCDDENNFVKQNWTKKILKIFDGSNFILIMKMKMGITKINKKIRSQNVSKIRLNLKITYKSIYDIFTFWFSS